MSLLPVWMSCSPHPRSNTPVQVLASSTEVHCSGNTSYQGPLSLCSGSETPLTPMQCWLPPHLPSSLAWLGSAHTPSMEIPYPSTWAQTFCTDTFLALPGFWHPVPGCLSMWTPPPAPARSLSLCVDVLFTLWFDFPHWLPQSMHSLTVL